MTTTRRRFLAMSAATGSALTLGARAAGETPLRILILGGTGFIGPHMVERALARGHHVTLFNRGRTNAELFPTVTKLLGDRDGDLDALRSHRWDAVIDNSGYVPRHVRDSAQLLKKRARQYLFVSSVSAYADFAQSGIDESYRVGTLADPHVEEVTAQTYGPLKALCEQAVAAAFPNGTIIVRPGYIVGPGDSTDRWTYWPVRLAAGGNMLVPGTPRDPVQLIDARDLAAFVIGLVERHSLGVFNAVGPVTALTMGDMLDALHTALDSNARFTWVSADFLRSHDAAFPIWSPPTGETRGLHEIDNTQAVAAGLTTRPVAGTGRDTLRWWDTQSEKRRAAMRSGLRIPPELPPGPQPLTRQLSAERRLLSLASRVRS